jgi:uncharacterized iron-regulated membrane protein
VSAASGLYRTIWRWHFYAGLFVLPFVFVLALTGSVYLFKPQVERWEERAFQGQSMAAPAPPHQQLEAARAAYPDSTFLEYRLPEREGDSALIRLSLAEGAGVREVFVSPGGEVLGAIDPDKRIMAVTKRIHSQLLIGDLGNRLVELAASWAIVMILTGLYLWWPRGRGPAGVVWPRLASGKRVFWRDLHAVTGFWVSSLALVLLVSGLPWAGVWGPAFAAVRAEMGWVNGPAQWDIDGARPAAASTGHGHHHHDGAPMATPDAPYQPHVFDQMVVDARAEGLAFPAIVTPPGAPGRFGAPGQMLWTIRSDVQNPPLRTTIRYDLNGRSVLAREEFRDNHPIDRVVAYGIAWHEGRLFGWVNQAIGVLTALMLIALVVSGAVMWLRRRPAGALGAPPYAGRLAHPRAVGAAALLLALLLPLFALSLAAIWLLELLVLRRSGPVARWLGLRPAASN